MVILLASGIYKKSAFLTKGVLIGLVLFAFTTFPPYFLGLGFAGILLCLLLILQNGMGIAGLFLTAFSIGHFLSKKPLRLTFHPKGRLFLPAVGLVFFALCAAVSKFVLGGIPHVGDGVIQLLQAKIFASGSFTVPAPKLIEFFFDPFMVVKEGRWFAQYPPGFALMLVPGLLINHPELINPLLAGLTVIFFGLSLKELNLSPWWALLFMLSPFVCFMSGSFMSHPAAMFWGGLGILLFLKSKREKPMFMLLWGISAGFMFSVKPFTALCFNLPLVLFALRKKIGWGIITFAGGFILGALPYFVNSYFTTGSFFTSGYQAAWGSSGLFFNNSQWGPPHTPQAGILHLAVLMQGLNSRLFELPLPALCGVILWLLFKSKSTWKEWAVFSAGICGFAGYYFYFYVDMAYGPRFAYSAAFPLLLITVLGLKALFRRLRESGWSKSMAQWSFLGGAVILLCLWAVISLPARVNYYSNNYRDVDNKFNDFIEDSGITNAVVFLDDYPSSDRHARLFSLGFTNRQSWYYAWRLNDSAVEGALKMLGISPEEGFGLVAPLSQVGRALNQYWGNPRFLPSPAEDMDKLYVPLKQGYIYIYPLINNNDIIFARNLSVHNRRLMEEYPDRNFFTLERLPTGYALQELKKP